MPMKNPPHPGLSVRHDCLEPLRFSVTQAAQQLGVSRKQTKKAIPGRLSRPMCSSSSESLPILGNPISSGRRARGRALSWRLLHRAPTSEIGRRSAFVMPVLGVQEYWQYDPRGMLLSPRLQGHTLEHGAYVPLSAPALSSGSGMHSPVLGLDIRMEGEMLRFHDPVTGHDLRTQQEEALARQEAEARLAELEARLQDLQQM